MAAVGNRRRHRASLAYKSPPASNSCLVSYRSFKRVLGETNLERKCRFFFGASLFLLITGSFLWYGEQTKDIVYQQNPKTGRLLVHTVMMHHWEHLETKAGFKPVVKALIADIDKEDYEWRAIRPTVNNPKEPFQLCTKRPVIGYLQCCRLRNHRGCQNDLPHSVYFGGAKSGSHDLSIGKPQPCRTDTEIAGMQKKPVDGFLKRQFNPNEAIECVSLRNDRKIEPVGQGYYRSWQSPRRSPGRGFGRLRRIHRRTRTETNDDNRRDSFVHCRSQRIDPV